VGASDERGIGRFRVRRALSAAGRIILENSVSGRMGSLHVLIDDKQRTRKKREGVGTDGPKSQLPNQGTTTRERFMGPHRATWAHARVPRPRRDLLQPDVGPSFTRTEINPNTQTLREPWRQCCVSFRKFGGKSKLGFCWFFENLMKFRKIRSKRTVEDGGTVEIQNTKIRQVLVINQINRRFFLKIAVIIFGRILLEIRQFFAENR
jgi:hypothetical protein